ncbi:GNAT family N-acetyltransferase [Mumia quercus]|uniref:GNAT family N-acetyltransferase n=1 Tax=Mumia quercus TaxID=2976125 RepID=UPI0021CE8BE2|nr:GNAT family N-acetyltransferase [Mumia quercus]
MLFRVRTTIKDRPGVLASLARSCGEGGINILSLQVFPSHDGVTDELVVSVAGGWTEVAVRDLVAEAGGEHVAVTRCTARSLRDAPTGYLQAAARVVRGTTSIAEELVGLLETDPPDVADYAGHDTIVLDDHTVARAVAFTPVERARAHALHELVTAVVSPQPARTRLPLPDRAPASRQGRGTVRAPAVTPQIRATTADDTSAVADMHTRCGEETLYRRYHAPMTGVIHRRMARRLVAPVGGSALVAEVGARLVGHAMVVPTDEETPGTWELGVIVEDAWQRKGIGTALVRRGARLARACGAEEVVLVTQPGNDALLKTVGRAGFLARITRVDATVRVTVDVTLC